jgi:hypothetical protein
MLTSARRKGDRHSFYAGTRQSTAAALQAHHWNTGRVRADGLSTSLLSCISPLVPCIWSSCLGGPKAQAQRHGGGAFVHSRWRMPSMAFARRCAETHAHTHTRTRRHAEGRAS